MDNLNKIWSWNATVPASNDSPVHEIFAKTAYARPDEPAVCAHDGDWTYKELHDKSTILAQYLVSNGVGNGHIIPICFEKSKYTAVAALAVMKSGAASVLLDPSLPKERLLSITSQIIAPTIICSRTQLPLSIQIVSQETIITTLDDDTLTAICAPHKGTLLPKVSPSDRLYIIFTSGTTGTPKGAVINHSNYASAILHQREAHGFTRHSRVYDFSSYAFDVSWSNMIHTLTIGACLLIPSDSERRNDLAGSIVRLRATHVDITPSIARVLPDSVLKQIDVLVLGGEKLTAEHGRRWSKLVKQLKNPYGPSECTPTATITTLDPDAEYGGSIGRGLGLNTWIVDSEDPNTLVPIGETGELLLEGPLVGDGYLDATKNIDAFTIDPEFLVKGAPGGHCPGRRGRLYKTGDLVRYDKETGDIIFIGRKDTQVKINGQRVELGDIEHHLRQALPTGAIEDVAVEMIQPTSNETRLLVAFFAVKSNIQNTETPLDLDKILAAITEGLEDRLSVYLPTYMIPAVFVPLAEFPLSQTGKTDRKQLQSIAQSMNLAAMVRVGRPCGQSRAPATTNQMTLRQLWSSVLGIEESSISIDDSFVRLGGDSITAMKLVAAAREIGFHLTVSDIFLSPILKHMAEVSGGALPLADEVAYTPLSLLKHEGGKASVLEEAANLLRITRNDIEDILPCTSLQEGLMSLSMKRDGDYIVSYCLKLQPSVDLPRLCKAWATVVSNNPILRTRIINLNSQGLVQVVLRHIEAVSFQNMPDLEELAQEQPRFGMETSLAKFALASCKGDGDTVGFLWQLHHAVYDGWSVKLMIEQLEMAYVTLSGEVTPVSTFHPFIRYINDVNKDDSETFWKLQAANIETQAFPLLPSPTYEPKNDGSHGFTIDKLQWPVAGGTAPSALRASLALLMSLYTGASDAVFGAVTSGRQAPLPYIESLVAPTIATVPVRVSVDRSQDVKTFLANVQKQSLQMIAFEQIGLHNIRNLSADAAQLCNFQTLLVVQPVEDLPESHSTVFVDASADLHAGDMSGAAALGTYSLTIECLLEANAVSVRFTFDSNIIGKQEVERFARQYEHILRQLCEPDNMNRQLADVQTVNEDDLRSIWCWNSTVPEAYNVCVHHLIEQTAERQPDAPAVCAWDGDFSYAELNTLATRLALQLTSLHVNGTIIPLLFEKSKWTTVAMLAAIKAGAAFVALDASQPEERLRTIVDQVNAAAIVSSISNSIMAQKLTSAKNIILNSQAVNALQHCTGLLPTVDPSQPLYMIFTSGSTGTPKGVVISHTNFSSAILHQQDAHGFEPRSRVYDFASYAFDVSVSNFFHTLTIGACLCIPSDEDRRDDLAGSLSRFQVTHADLTPSTAAVLPEETLKSLTTLVLGGEKLSPENARRWSSLVTVKNPYGPSECTPTATLQHVTPTDSFTASIGKGLGLNTWVADSATGQNLVPIGAVGELLLEGPLVGLGYFGDEAKTRAAFAENLAFLAQGGPGKPGREGRLYKTGDLVRYNADGSLGFIGRKDAQVKINGQRVELSDIETHITYHANTRQASCVYPKSGLCANKVIGFFSIHGLHDPSTENGIELLSSAHKAIATSHIDNLELQLRDSLPAYMIPSLWVPLKSLPLSTSGKLDSKRLRQWIEQADEPTMLSLSTFVGTNSLSREPATEMEQILRSACSAILNIPLDTVNLNKSFIANGGDSISAMRMSAHCRAANATFSVAQLLKSKSLAAFAADGMKTATAAPTLFAEESNKLFNLSPIQQWFIEQAPHTSTTQTAWCNQGFYLKLSRQISSEELARALDSLVQHHSMLRSRFQVVDGKWMQLVLPSSTKNNFLYSQHHHPNLDAISSLAMRRHQELNPERGPVFSADLSTIDDGTNQYLILVAHHLVVDLVSWRILLEDLEALLSHRKLLSSMPFQTWTELQEAQASTLSPETVLSTSNTGNNIDFWQLPYNRGNNVEDHDVRTVLVSRDISSYILTEANNALNTEPVEILMAGVWHAFFAIFADRSELTMFSEGHGREPWSTNIDISRTVGWFTSISPINTPQSIASTKLGLVRYIKDARRRLQANGWAYFTARYLTKQGRDTFKNHGRIMEMTFNYHGQFQQLEKADAFFSNVALHGVQEQGPQLPASSLFGIEVSIEDGMAVFSVSANRYIAYQDKIKAWIDTIPVSLNAICKDLQAYTGPPQTLCDYPFLSLDHQSLEILQTTVSGTVELANNSKIQNILPCTPTIDGILISQIKDPKSYKTMQRFRLTSDSTTSISLKSLADAWQKVVSRQPALRTTFVPSLDSSSAFYQVVLEKHVGNVMILDDGASDEASAAALLDHVDSLEYVEGCPPHRVILCRISSHVVVCQMEMSHAITDGASTQILQKDWIGAYTNDLSTGNLAATAEAFVQTLASTSKDSRDSYWREKLNGAEPCTFPTLSHDVDSTQSISSVCEINGNLLRGVEAYCAKLSITVASFLQTAWALSLAAYTTTNSVVFGYLASGRDFPITGMDEIVGAYTNMLVCRVEIDRQASGSSLLRAVHDQIMEDLDYQHSPLAVVQHELASSSEQGLFNSIVSYQQLNDIISDKRSGFLNITALDGEDPTEYDIVANISHGEDNIEILLDHKSNYLSKSQADRFLSLLLKICSSLSNECDAIQDLELVSDKDIARIWHWNKTLPVTSNRCVHDLIKEMTSLQPEATAIEAWDGSFSYAQLDDLATQLAQELVNLGVVNGHVVPLCVEKSRWTAVLMLGVMKAGGASVILDSSQPEDRLRAIVNQTNSTVILSSGQSQVLASLLARPGTSSLAVDQEFFATLVESTLPLPKVSPEDSLYVVFTSGSTGVPKGVVVTHANIASAILHQRSGLQFDKESRIFDFSSYMFDVAWCNLLQGLSAGSCICIPADEDRKADFTSAIARFNANSLILTPSALRGHNLAALDALKSLHFIGEPLRAETFASIHPSVSVTNLYGPTECTTFSTMLKVSGRDKKYISIGVGSGLNTWVVDSTTSNTLVPIGVTGELLLEGPLVSAGYLGDKVKTKLAFVDTPQFLSNFGRAGRLYKTGDLVRYNADGSLEFMGRKDAQVKINGIRVELGDIESGVKSCLIQEFEHVEVVTEVVTLQGTSHAMLIAFICFGKHLTQDMDADALENFTLEATKDLRNVLAAKVAAHMIPSAYVALPEVPYTASGKIDRRILREKAKSLSWEKLLSRGANKRRAPRTPMECQLQTLWSTVLDIEPHLIGVDDNFLHIGGDSVGAMRLVGAAREVGTTISVVDILRHPKLSDMALLVRNKSSNGETHIEPFSLMDSLGTELDQIIHEAAMTCNVSSSDIEDMYPCTPLQEGLLALTAQRSGDYIIRCALELKDGCDISRFKAAWESVLNTTPVLRTRVVDITGKGLTQVSVKYQPSWRFETPITSLNEYTERDAKEEFALGSPLARHALLTAGGRSYFMLTLHHAIYDGWSLNLVFDRLEKAYEGQSWVSGNEFCSFVKHIQSIDKSGCEKFWVTQLSNSEAQAFPVLPSPSHQPMSDQKIVHDIQSINWEQSDVTPSSKIRAALAILTSTYMNSPDVIYGATTTGRQVAVPGIASIIGPTIATVPVQISVPPSSKVSQFLAMVQEQAIEMINYEQMGLQNIKRLHTTAERLCNFQTLLIVQPADESAEWRSNVISRDVYESGSGGDNTPQESDTYALTLECLLKEDGIKIKMSFDSSVIDELQSWRFLRQFEHVIRQLSNPTPEQLVSDISCVSEQDVKDIWKWNESIPDTVQKCVHELITETCCRQPTSQAVCAWDGDWSYAELDELSTILGHQLIDHGIRPGDIIPLLFEKSRWMPIAMLAVMKTGAASVAVDTSQPTDRLRSIINQVKAQVVLCSESKQELASSISSAKTVVLGNSAVRSGSALESARLFPSVSPGSLLYLVFTSGSTGTPKGVMVTHSNFTSAIKHQKVAQGILPTSRVFDFASYAFDVAWANPILAFEVGATLCIPSDSDRKDDLNGSIARLKPTHADLTPSAALVLSDESLNTLHSLTLGGERLAASSAEHWATFPNLTVKNSYGPSECTPTSTFTEAITAENAQNNSIGQAYGLNTWVADAATGQQLVPIGGVGELLLEGPLLGAGYLSDREKTDAAFISNPKFLHDGPQGQYRGGRLYRTGDIVKYNSDGSVAFVGRKDAQVKINGQRVELSEIESHIGRFEATHQCVIVFPTNGPCAKRLVCIVQFKDIIVDDSPSIGGIQLVSSGHDKAVSSNLTMLQEQLQVGLPRYMIPSIWITAAKLPMTASGKQDRRSVNNWVSEMSPEVFAQIDRSESAAAAREPTTEMERIVRDACCSILNIEHEKLNLDRSFIANGGDSISAMRLASQLRVLGISFSVSELLQSKTLEGFALSTKKNYHTAKSYEESFNTLFPLSPIQQWYFDQNPPSRTDNTETFYNQGFYVKLTRDVPTDEIIGAIAQLVDCHSMLRARFQQQDGIWMQCLLPPSVDAYHVGLASYESLDAVKALAQERHRGIDLEKGPVFSADICDLQGDQYLVLVAHHLVIDLVSWRIILDDLKMLLESVDIEKSIPFRVWNDLQNEKAKSLLPASTLSTTGISNNLEFWSNGFTPTPIPNNVSDHDIMHINVDQETTSLLLGSANVAFNTEPVEILLASVWHAFLAAFPDRQSLTIFNEGHGRESWSAEIDLSRTIGWFTTLSPLHVFRSNSIATLVRTIKDARRYLPYNGWAYFASRYLNELGQIEFQSHNEDMELVFNYHGQFQLLEDKTTLFEDVNLEGVSEQGYSFPASSFFNIEVAIDHGQTCFDFSFNRHLAHQDRIKQWGHGIRTALEEICRDLARSKPSRTLCDFELLSLNYSTLDTIVNDLIPQIESINQCSVQEVLPCSPTVDGMLLSQVKQNDAYKTRQTYEISSAQGDSISLQSALAAWQHVIKHQPALRTVFISGQDGSSAFDQVVLSQHTGEVIVLSAEDSSEALQKIQSIPAVNYDLLKPPHRAVFCKTPDKIFWQLEMSHAITDGTSAAVLEQNFIDFYHGRDLATDMSLTMREYARILSRTDKLAKAAFWKTKLSNMVPCHFPRLAGVSYNAGGRSEELTVSLKGSQLNRIMQFCTTRMVTPASLLKSAWAFTLSSYTGQASVCFGYLASGRDFDVPHLQESVGAYTNLMICRADVSDDLSGEAFVQRLHDQLMEDLSYQHCSLAKIQHDLGIGSDQQLFNSIVSYQRISESSGSHDSRSIKLNSIDGDDPTEYEIGLGINHGSSTIELDLSYLPTYLTKSQAARVLSHMRSTIEAIIEGNRPLSLSSEDLQDIWSWNASVPEAHEVCVHDLIAETAAKQPDHPAVCAWDGDFTYQELDTFATQLAHYLLELGLSSDAVVPHCVEKSKWASIATLAVMKAGGASVTLDVNQPFERLESIVRQVTSPIIIASPSQVQLASRLHSGKMVVIGDSLFNSIALTGRRQLPKVSPSCQLYINFTSGSTGIPKGVVITHSNYSSAIKHQQQAHFFKPTSRVFDFAYQSFDVSWSNFCHTFTIGACLCVPSEDERRNDAAGAIRRMRVTHADMTPSAISTLPLEILSQLDTIVLGGEKLSPENARAWSAVTKVLNPYGPCECTPTSTITEVDAAQAASGNITIGRGLGLNTWIVDVLKGDTLVPIGAVGELVLEGPLVGGYLGGDTKSTAFITGSAYLAQGTTGHPGRSNRMYKTGDLVRYNIDGTLTFVGRKDGQVKINGQRVELGDIESHIESCLADSNTTQVVAEVITPAAIGKPILVAFMLAVGDQLRNMDKDEFQAFVNDATNGLDERLASRLPPHMRPVAYIPIMSVPMTATGKTDRRQLRALGAKLTRQDLAAAAGSELEYREPTGSMETGLQKLWAAVLDIDQHIISANDNFLKLGGDSISAMRLVTAARENGFLISVPSILTSKSLADQALSLRTLTQVDKADEAVYEPFSLQPTMTSAQKDALYAQLYELGISSNTVEDIMPVTDHQSRCIALTHSAARNLLLYQTMDGNGAPNIAKLRATCAALVQRFDLLRTVFVPHNDQFLQVVLKEIDVYVPVFTIRNGGVTFDEQTEQIRQHDLTVQIPFGRPLTRISILHNAPQQKYRIIVRMSHAQHDGMSLVKMWDAFESMYNESLNQAEPIVPHPKDVRKASFSNYMFALSRMDKEAAVNYWSQLLEGSTMTTMTQPTTYKLTYDEGPAVAVEIPRSTMEGSEFTFSTILKSAWAYTLAQATAEDDIVFGGLTHGRGLLGVDEVFGACVNIIPTRVKFRQNWTARDLVSHLNDQQIASMRHEALGTRDIVRACTDWASWTFAGTVVYHHNFEDSTSAEHERGMHVEESTDLNLGDLDMVDIHITSKAHKDCYKIELSFAPGLFSESEAQKLSHLLRSTILLFQNDLETPLSMPSETKPAAALHPPTKQRSHSISASEAICTGLKASHDAKEVLHKAWSCTLNKPVESWNPDSRTFFESGGDLVAASVLAAHMELKGYSLSIEDIVRYPDWNRQLMLIERS